MAPARDVAGGRAAVDYGADALYVGGPAFGARTRAGNSVDDIARLVEYAHPFGVRVYATLNTLIFNDELPAAERTARELVAAGVDALIVQDMAFMQMNLGVELHASTQVCNVDPFEVAALARAGFSRVILERGLTLDEIKDIRAATDVELECFVHGAICVGFSGRCYLSRALSGSRSGNRGDCMQACRLSYDLLEDGREIAKSKYFLSPLDLDLSARLEDLSAAGVTSFKIEGRLKDINYVKNIVAYYRGRIDSFARGTSSGRVEYDFTPDPRRSFSRSATQWMLGDRRALANFDTPKATGEFVGVVEKVEGKRFVLNDSLRPGDGICFMAGGELRGTSVNHVFQGSVTPDKIDGIAVGTRIFRNYDKAFDDALTASRTRRVIDVCAILEDGVLTLTDEDGISVTLAVPLGEPARSNEMFIRQLSKTGGTIFNMVSVEVRGAVPFMPAAAINALRREGLEKLTAARINCHSEASVARRGISSYAGGDPSTRFTRLGMTGKGMARLGMTETNNITNRLAAQFYGVEQPAEPLELKPDLRGECVMTSAYCLRRELGRCPRRTGKSVGELTLRRGTRDLRLDFDCAACRMKIISYIAEK